jgi:predicted DNA-binding protein with PD1-like motif
VEKSEGAQERAEPMPTRFWNAGEGRVFVGRLATGSDLVEEIERFCAAEQVTAAWVSLVGAMRKVAYAYYDQKERRYIELETRDHHELSGFVGNVSMRDGKHFLHAHATFANERGETVGGHLLPGTRVFVAEVQIREMADVSLVRAHDEVTGLALW